MSVFSSGCGSQIHRRISKKGRANPRISSIFPAYGPAFQIRRLCQVAYSELTACFSTAPGSSAAAQDVPAIPQFPAEDDPKAAAPHRPPGAREIKPPAANVPTLFPTKRKPFVKPAGANQVLYRTQLGLLPQSSLMGAQRYNETAAEEADEAEAEAEAAGVAPAAAALHRYRARVLYDGSGYNGWQLQPAQPSVQGLLEAVLSFKLRQPVRVIGAGRSDTGVHARGQVARRRSAAYRHTAV